MNLPYIRRLFPLSSHDSRVHVSSTEPIDAEGKYILAKPADKAIGFYKAEGTIPANKAYLEIEGADVKGFAFVINGETAIESISSTIATDDAIFDLSGRRVEKATKGVYIINGKKVAVK